MREVMILLILLVILTLMASKGNPQDITSSTETVESQVLSATDSMPVVGVTELLEVTEVDIPDSEVISIPTDAFSETISSPTSPIVETETPMNTDYPEITPLPAETYEVTAETTTDSPPTTQPFFCVFDVNVDGVITQTDLSDIAQLLLNAQVSGTTLKYDLNANHRIDIGDLQAMTSYLSSSCPS